MSEFVPRPASRIVPIAASPLPEPAGATIRPLPVPLEPGQASACPLDARARPLRDLRISVTDRCNFRCGYCMPRSAFGRDHAFLPHAALLSFEEITRAARVFMTLGVRKLRITGGEPLLRKDLERLVAQLAALRTLDGTPADITLTTNGTLLARKAQALKDAGLQRVTVSLDALEAARFRQMSDAEIPVDEVLEGIDAALRSGLGPLKVNMVVQRGVNDDQILPMARHFRGTGIALRFIEFMDVGRTNRWDLAHVLPSGEVRSRLHAAFPLRRIDRAHPGDTAERWEYADGQGEVGFISSVTQAFCGDCNRIRLSTEGRLYTCLFASEGYDLRSHLRATGDAREDDATLAARLAALWSARQDRYSQLRGSPEASGQAPPSRIEMSYIGG